MKTRKFLSKSLLIAATLTLPFMGNNFAYAKTTNISLPTAATSGALYPLGATIANIWNTKVKNVNVRVQASNGGVQNLNLLKAKEAQVSFAVTNITYEALHGQSGFKGRAYEDVRILAGLYYNPNQIVALESSNVKTLADFKGKRFAPGAPGGTSEVESRVHFTALGMKYPNDIRAQFVGPTEAIDLMRNKQLDGVWIMAGTPTASVTEMTTTAGAKLVSMTPELVKKVQEQAPWYSEYIIPANTYDNQPEDIRTTAIKMLIIVDASVSDDLVYELTKAFWENLATLQQSHSVMRDVDISYATKDLSGIPLHKGSEKYYREKGLIK